MKLAIEIIASCLVLTGIAIEVMTGAEAGYAMITVGSVGVAAGGILYNKSHL